MKNPFEEINEQDYQFTKNQYGVNLPISTFDAHLLLEIMEEAAKQNKELHVLFIATAFCALAVKAGKIATKASNISITFNDLSADNLAVLKETLQPLAKDNIKYCPIDIFKYDPKEEKYDAIVCHNLFHFLPGEKIDELLDRIFFWLKPGGTFHVVTASHHQGLVNKLNLLKKDEKIKQNCWPYFFSDYRKLVEPFSPELAKHLPESIHFIPRKKLADALTRHGFKVVRAEYSPIPSHAPERSIRVIKWDGKEDVAALAEKPLTESCSRVLAKL